MGSRSLRNMKTHVILFDANCDTFVFLKRDEGNKLTERKKDDKITLVIPARKCVCNF